ncbi:hypothetical protein BELL_0480g00020 [Botrytis elliptica]|uniref:Copper transporter n=1 Tax=Botrytis elliptica TaxID=278938 RepID=A0A4Z1JLT8_9HELO|nr:hypothetical protein BELL_0480g00020 [Botrytis elliptica]
MKALSLLIVWSFLSVIIASLLSAPTPVFTATTTISASSSSKPFLARKDWRNGNPREGFQVSKPSETSGEDPLITAAPSAEEIRLQEKYHLTTYWSCVTLQTFVHCGWYVYSLCCLGVVTWIGDESGLKSLCLAFGSWRLRRKGKWGGAVLHEPILAGGTEIAGASCGSCNAGKVALMAAGAVMVAGAL